MIQDIASSIGKLLTSSLFLIKSAEDLSLLNELVALAKTVLSKSKSSSSVVQMLTFVEKVIDLYELNDTTHLMIKDTLLLSYDAILRTEKAEGADNAQFIVATMFKPLSACAKRHPLLLLTLARGDKEVGEVIHSCIEASPCVLKSNEPDIIKVTLNFLAVLKSSLESISIQSLEDEEKKVIVPVIDYINRSFRGDILISLVTLSCCGICLHLSKFSSLIQQILFSSQWQDVEASISAALCTNQFLLGDEVKRVAVTTFERCTRNKYPASTFTDMITEMWNMHQTDDTGAIAGGEAVLQFVKKFNEGMTTLT